MNLHESSPKETGEKPPTMVMNKAHPEYPEHSPAHHEASKTGRKLKRFAGTVAVVLILGFFAVHRLKSAQEKDLTMVTSKIAAASPMVDVITVQKAPSSVHLTLPGETAAWYKSIIYARVDGYVASWNADIGDDVKKGEVLATIDTPDLDAQLAAARAKLEAASASVVSRQAAADFARTTYQRWKDSPKGVVSEQEREEKKAAYDSAIAQLDEAKAQVGLVQAEADRFMALTEFKKVIAPYHGRIVERRIDIGNLVTAGSTASTTPLYQIEQDNPIRIFIDVPQSVTGDIKVGVPTQIVVSNIPNRVFNGKVTRNAEGINPETRTLLTEVDIPNADHALASGMYVNVSFQLPAKGLVQVPAAALLFRTGGPQIAVVNKDSRITFQDVTIARDDGNTIEIGSGVSLGDKIALNISEQITGGEMVKTHEFSEEIANAPTHK
ncbi:MAG: efflux RND transporter periplasmic adaptor subunit [Nitrospiria bacterium]